MVTIEILKSYPDTQIFRRGEFNSSDFPDLFLPIQINANNNLISWIAKKGSGYDDWAIYYHYSDIPEKLIISNGIKIKSIPIIRKLVPCTPEVLNKYRF